MRNERERTGRLSRLPWILGLLVTVPRWSWAPACGLPPPRRW